AAGKLRHAHSECLHQIGGKTDGAVLEALHVTDRPDLVLEPPERLRRHRKGEHSIDVQAEDVLGKLAIKLVATALVEPGQHRVRVAAPDRSGAEEGSGLGLAVPVGRDAVGDVDDTIADGIHYLERTDD